MRHFILRPLAGLALAATATLAACGSDATGPSAGGSSQVGTPMSISQFDSTLGTGSTRIEIVLNAGTLQAHEVHVEQDDAEEKITSPVTAIDTAAGNVTLAFGGMVLSYGSSPRFRTPSKSRVSRAEWEAAIVAALGAGQQPTIEARRNQPAQPQAPTDPTFLPNDLRISDKNDGPKLEVYVDADNFQDVAAPPPLAILTVFSVPVEITSSTEISLNAPGGTVPSGPVQFQGAVTAADAAAGTITLAGGIVVDLSGASFDPKGDVFSVDATASALAAGKSVTAEGVGTASGAGPITATSVKVETGN